MKTSQKLVTLFGGGLPFDYYVDSVSGNDANDGKTPATPKLTIAALPTITAGMRIGLAKGSTFYESLTIPANNVHIGAYGTGNAPIFDQRDAIAAGAWSKTGGLTAVYEASVTTEGLAGKTWVRAWEDATGMVRATSAANCDAVVNSYYPSSDVTAGAITLYVHASDGSNPGTNGKVYKFTARQYGYSATGRSGCSLDGVRFIANLHLDGSVHLGTATGSFVNASNLLVEEGTAHNIIARPGSNLLNVDCHNSYYAGSSATMIILNGDVAAGETSTFTNCTMRQDAKGAAITGFYCHRNTSGTFGTITLTNCIFTNTNGPASAANTALVILNGCTVTNNDAGVTIVNAGIEYRLLNHTHVGSNNNALVVQAANTVLWDGGTCSMTTSLSQTIYCSVAATLTIQNVTFDGGTGSCIWMEITVGAALAVFDFNHNHYDNYDNYVYYLQPTNPTLTSDYNHFELANNRFNYNATLYANVAAWQAVGYDAHSTAA